MSSSGPDVSLWTREEALTRLWEMNGIPDRIAYWNEYRRRYPDWGSEDSGPALSEKGSIADLHDVKLAFKDKDEVWHGADLHGLTLFAAIMNGADLHAVDLRGTVLSHAWLENVELKYADLSEANLRDAHLQRVSLYRAKLHGAKLQGADLTAAHCFKVRYDRDRMLGRYLGVRGLSSCYGDAYFRRDAMDQDYIDTAQFHADTRMRKTLFSMWKMIDFGRSLWRVMLIAILLSLTFGSFFCMEREMGWELMEYERSADSWLSPFYYSIVTYTTLGFGDITPRTWIGEVVVSTEVVFGYLTLGLILSILANKVARRA